MKNRFVVQLHNASHLHYDFRLEIGGVLVSWAVPKGPSLNPEDKRLAVKTNDHDIDYLDFEGIIKEGYGKGSVIVWDIGTYGNLKKQPIEECLQKGSISIELKGKKLKGGFNLVKMKDKNWLFMKITDKYVSKRNVTKKNRSVISEKKVEEL